MKNLITTSLILSTMTIMGCTSIPTHKEEFTATKIKDSNWININIESAYKGISVSLENKVEDVIEIDWNSSSLDGSNLFMDGQKYIDAGKQVPIQVIAPYSTIRRSLYKANTVYFSSGKYGGWNLSDANYPSKLVIKAINGKKSQFIIYDLNKKMIPIKTIVK